MDEKILHLDKSNIDLYKECFDSNDSPKELKVIEWQFLRNDIKSYVNILVDNEAKRTAAIYATCSLKFKFGGEIIVGAQSLDTITDLNYRGKGFFIKLANRVYETAKDGGVKLVYGFPNGNSVHGFKSKLGWKVLDPVPFLIKPLRTGYFTKMVRGISFLPDCSVPFKTGYVNDKIHHLEQSNHFPPECDELWDSFSANIGIAVHRNRTYLEWRYIDKPGESYRIVHCRDRKQKYLGYIVYVAKEKHGGLIGYVMELIYEPKQSKAGEQLLAFAINDMKKTGCDAVMAWCMDHSLPYDIYKKKLFMKMPEMIRPIELHFGALAFDDSLKTVIENRENWYLSYSDSDTV